MKSNQLYMIKINQNESIKMTLAKDKQVFGYYSCSKCENEWASAYSHISLYTWQKCEQCNKYKFPVHIRKIEPNVEFADMEKRVKFCRKKNVLEGPFFHFRGYKEPVLGRYRCHNCHIEWKSDDCWVLIHWTQKCKYCNTKTKPNSWKFLKPNRQNGQNGQNGQNPQNGQNGQNSQHESKLCEKCQCGFFCKMSKIFKSDECEQCQECNECKPGEQCQICGKFKKIE